MSGHRAARRGPETRLVGAVPDTTGALATHRPEARPEAALLPDASGARPATRAVRAAIATDPQHGAVVPPIHLTTTFAFAGFAQARRYDYTRTGNPTRDQLADAIAELEGGAGACVTSSGMSAVLLALQLLEPDDLLLAPHDCYGGTYRLIRSLAAKRALRAEFIEMSDPCAVERIRVLSPRVVWVETPSNPLLRITDVPRIAAAAHEAGALLAVDNTFLSPALQRPIALGADVVVHSTTKYLNGHSDVVGGVAVAADESLHERLAWWANCLGITGAPFDSYLTLRGLRTLHARMAIHESNARALVDRLASHAAVRQVYHPSLRDHPGHEIAAGQQDGFGAMIGVELHGGIDAVEAFLGGLRAFTLAESLGGVESLVAHPATMTHASMDAAARERAGIRDSLIRLSVGIEDARDLIEDVERALERAGAAAVVAV